MSAGPLPSEDDVIRPPPEGSAWVVAHTRPRCEKRVAEFCRLQGLSAYIPLRSKTHSYGGRRRTFSSPLFPGYVFCVTDPRQKTLLRQSRHTANLLDVLDQAGLVRQLIQIRSSRAMSWKFCPIWKKAATCAFWRARSRAWKAAC
jgi:hypothetical protein